MPPPPAVVSSPSLATAHACSRRHPLAALQAASAAAIVGGDRAACNLSIPQLSASSVRSLATSHLARGRTGAILDATRGDAYRQDRQSEAHTPMVVAKYIPRALAPPSPGERTDESWWRRPKTRHAAVCDTSEIDRNTLRCLRSICAARVVASDDARSASPLGCAQHRQGRCRGHEQAARRVDGDSLAQPRVRRGEPRRRV